MAMEALEEDGEEDGVFGNQHCSRPTTLKKTANRIAEDMAEMGELVGRD